MSAATVDLYRAEKLRVPFADYLELPALNASSLKDAHVSALLYKSRREQPRPDTDTLRIGRAAHTAILEPRRFLKEYVQWDEANGRRFGKKWDAFCEANAGKTVLRERDYDLALLLSDRVRAHAVAGKILAEPGECETSITWTHPRTGRRCKSRIDWLCSAVVDVKTTRDPSPGRFAGDCARLGYALQLAFYADAVAAMGGDIRATKIIAVQNVEPYDVVVYDVPDEVLNVGREQYEAAIDRVIECEKSGAWPGIAPDEALELRLPAWAQIEDEPELTFNGQAL